MSDKVIFLDRISIVSIVRLLLLGRPVRECEQLCYFDTVTVAAQCLLGILNRLALLKAQARPAEYFFGKLRTPDGGATWLKFEGTDMPTICRQIEEEELARSTFLRYLGSKGWDVGRLLLYFEKEIYKEIVKVKTGIQINVVEWLSRPPTANRRNCVFLLIERNRWFRYLQDYAKEQDVRLVSYPGAWRLSFELGYLTRLKAIGTWLKSWLKSRLRFRPSPGRADGSKSQGVPPTVAASSRATLAIHHTGYKVSFDPGDRSDLFWLPDSGIPSSDVLLYFTRPDTPLTDSMAALLKEKGIRFIAMNAAATRTASAPIWRPSSKLIKTALRLTLTIGQALLNSLLRGEWKAICYARRLGPFVFKYAYWHDFFAHHHIKANIDRVELSPSVIGQQLALQDLGGVNIAHQWSALSYVTVDITSASNLLFVFSQAYPELWQICELPVDQCVSVGYIYDSAFSAVQARARRQRQALEEKGAQFTICFFDENSSNDRNLRISHEDTTRDYEFLLNQLLADSTLGLVCKPKKPSTLFQRISRIAPLIEEAKETDRWLLLQPEDSSVSSIFPAEGGLIADVSIGMASGTTAAMEAYLAGVPAVLIDTYLFKHPFYAWGRNKVIFDNWDELFATLSQYRKDTASVPGFGDWSPVIEQLDPFRDGKAALRMGRYLHWVLQSLQADCTPDDALQTAAAQYAERWGADKIIPRRSTSAEGVV